VTLSQVGAARRQVDAEEITVIGARSARREVLAVIAILAFGLLTLYPVLTAQFVLVDDHEILNVLPPLGADPGEGPHLDLPGIALAADPAVGRFRPLYWTIRYSEIALLGDRPNAWHALVLSYGLISAGLLYATARTLGGSRLEAVLLGAWLLVAPGISSQWVRLGADDTRATVFLTLALLAAAKASRAGDKRASIDWDALLVLAASAAALTKEAFALASIAVAFFRAWLTMSRTSNWRLSAVPVAAWLIVLAAVGEIAAAFRISAAAGQFSHGGRYLALPDPASYIGSIAHNAAILAFVGMLWIAPLLVFAAPRGHWRPLVLAGLPILVLVGPQLLLYSEQGVFEGKYEAAAAIGVASLALASVAWLRLAGRVRRHRIAVGVWAAALVLFGFSTWTYAQSFTDDSIQLGQMVHTLATSTAANQTIAIAADPGRQYEPVLSLLDHLRHQGRDDLQVKLLPLPPDRPYSPLETSLATDLTTSFVGQLLNSCDGLGAVIVLGDEASTRSALSCLAQGFRRDDFTTSVLLWGGDAVSLRPHLPGMTNVGYALLLPTP
jgi:hypothetical protein